MRREDLIINGRKLNFIQKWLFEKDNKKIREYIKSINLLLMLGFITLAFQFWQRDQHALIWIVLIVEFITIRYYDKFIEKYVYVWTGDEYGYLPKEIEKAVNATWIINSEKLENIYKRDNFKKTDPVVKIIMNSSGHSIIEDIKEKVILQIPTMVPQVDDITDKMMNSVMLHFKKTNEEIKIEIKKYDFSKKSIERLRNLYALANGIIQNNAFSKRALNVMPKEELINFLNEKFTLRTD